MPYKREGSKYWWIIVGGVRQSARTDNFEDAKALEGRLNHQRWQQQYMGVRPPKSWKEAVVKYLQERKHKPSYDTIVQRLKWWDAHLRLIPDLRNVTRDMIDSILQKHRNITALPSPGNTTANKYAGIVGAVLTAACREWGWIESTPKFRKYPEPDHRRVWLSVEQWQKLESELPEHLLYPARFALATGLRAGKVFGLEWAQIDFKNRSLTTNGNELKRGNTIPLNRTAMRVLEDIKASGTVHLRRVFLYKGEPLQDYGDAWYKARSRAGVPDFPWHGFRHTFASWLGQSGAPETALDQLCGWAEKDTRSIYTHLHVEDLRRYSEVVDALLYGVDSHSSTQQENKLVSATA